MKVWEVIQEDTTAGGIATSMGGGNGFKNGGPGTTQRRKTKNRTEDKKSPVAPDESKMIRRNP